MKDTLTKAYAFNKHIRIYAATTTNLVKTAQAKHYLWPSSAAALGRTLTASAIMAILKDEDLTIKINGNGPIGDVFVDASKNGTVRGYVSEPELFFQYNQGPKKGHINVSNAVGTDGFLYVSRIINNEVFTSTSPLQTGEIADDFTYYFAASEQIPSSVGLGVLVNTDNTIAAAGGFILQVMPDTPNEVLDLVEEKIANLKDISQMVNEGYTPEDIIKEISNDDYEILEDNIPLEFKCKCNRERFLNALRLIDQKELDELIKIGHAEAVCHFCNEKYTFDKDELISLKK